MWWACWGSVPETSAAELQRLVDAAEKEPSAAPLQIVDVRTHAEYTAGHIPGAVHCGLWPVWSFPSRVARLGLDQSQPVYTICLSAHRSIAAQRHFQAAGFEASQLQGGMLSWRSTRNRQVAGKQPTAARA